MMHLIKVYLLRQYILIKHASYALYMSLVEKENQTYQQTNLKTTFPKQSTVMQHMLITACLYVF